MKDYCRSSPALTCDRTRKRNALNCDRIAKGNVGASPKVSLVSTSGDKESH